MALLGRDSCRAVLSCFYIGKYLACACGNNHQNVNLTDFYPSTFFIFITRLSLLHKACFLANSKGSKSLRLKKHTETHTNPGADIIPQNIHSQLYELSFWGLVGVSTKWEKQGRVGLGLWGWGGVQIRHNERLIVFGIIFIKMNIKEQEGREFYSSIQSLHRDPGEMKLSRQPENIQKGTKHIFKLD